MFNILRLLQKERVFKVIMAESTDNFVVRSDEKEIRRIKGKVQKFLRAGNLFADACTDTFSVCMDGRFFLKHRTSVDHKV